MNIPILRLLVIVLLLVLFSADVKSEETADTTGSDRFIGTWKGTSTCRISGSPCHDEIVVYHISKVKKPGHLQIAMNKIVNGAEKFMALIIFGYEEESKELVSVLQTGDTWKFRLSGKTLEGTLHYQGRLYRVINVTRL